MREFSKLHLATFNLLSLILRSPLFTGDMGKHSINRKIWISRYSGSWSACEHVWLQSMHYPCRTGGLGGWRVECETRSQAQSARVRRKGEKDTPIMQAICALTLKLMITIACFILGYKCHFRDNMGSRNCLADL